MTTFAAVQMTSGPDVAQNLVAAGSLVEAAAGAGAAVVLLPENFNFIGRRDADKRTVAEAYGAGPTQEFLAAAARRHGIWIIGGTQPLESEAADGRVTNTALVYDPSGHCVARYDKIHLFDVDVPGKPGETYRESRQRRARARRRARRHARRAGRALGLLRHALPGAVPRAGRAAGAVMLVMPAAFTVPTGEAHWETLLRARAVENLCYVVAAAQVGMHPAAARPTATAMIVDYWGRVLARLPRGSGVISATIDLDARPSARGRFPALENRSCSIVADEAVTHGRRPPRSPTLHIARAHASSSPPGSTRHASSRAWASSMSHARRLGGPVLPAGARGVLGAGGRHRQGGQRTASTRASACARSPARRPASPTPTRSSLPALEEASRAARAIARAGGTPPGGPGIRASHPITGHRLYLPVDPIVTVADADKVALLWRWTARRARSTRASSR